MPELNLIDAVREALFEEMARDESVIVLGEDVGKHGGVFRATDGLQRRFGADRVIDTPLAEIGIAGIAIGAAMNGLCPVAEIQFADYIHPAFDQIVNEAATLSYRSNGVWPCPVVFRAPCGAGPCRMFSLSPSAMTPNRCSSPGRRTSRSGRPAASVLPNRSRQRRR